MVGLATLRRDYIDDEFRNALWHTSQYARTGNRSCPHCHQNMRKVLMSEKHGNLELDVCRHCLCVWFDPSEYRELPHESAEHDRFEKLPDHPAAREAAAMMDLQRVQEAGHIKEARLITEKSARVPIEAWKWIPGLLGMPVEVTEPVKSSRPWATWGLSALIALIFLVTVSELHLVVRNWGFIPDEWSRHAGMTIVSSFFLHGGLVHLAGNLYFLLVFGDNVEDRLGRGKLVLLLLISHLAGVLLHAAFDPNGNIPLVGASAGISGVIAYYAIAFPRTRLGLLLFFFWWIRLPALAMLLLYGVLQVIGAYGQISGFGNVSNLGHLGGLVVGIVAAFIWRGRQGGKGLPRDDYFKNYRRME